MAKKKAPAREKRTPGTLPGREEILEFLRTAGTKAGKREIARAFSVKGGDRIALKQLLTEMADEGLLAGNRKGFKERGKLPPVAVLEIIARDKANLDLQWQHDTTNAAQGETPQALMKEIVKDLEEAIREFAAVESEIRR